MTEFGRHVVDALDRAIVGRRAEIEVVVAAISETPERLADESADVLYHLLVLWAEAGLQPDAVWAKLAAREGVSGLAEKRARGKGA